MVSDSRSLAARDRTFLGSASVIGSVFLLTASLNFLINVLVAKFFGAGVYTDVLFVGLTVANGIAPALISYLDAPFLPVFSGMTAPERAVLGSEVLVWFGGLFIGLGSLIWLSQSVWLPVFLHGVAANRTEVNKVVLLGTVGFIALGTTMAVQKTLLTAELRFGLIALTNVMPPAFTLASMVMFHRVLGTTSVVGGMAMGSLCALLTCYLGAGGNLRAARPTLSHARRLLRITIDNVPVSLGALLFALGTVLLRAVASLAGAGAISAQYYAERVFFLPHTLFAVSAGVVILPFLLRWRKEETEILARVAVYACLLLAPTTLILLVFGPDIVAIALQRGQFDGTAADLTAAALRGYSLGLLPLFIATLGWRMLQVRRKVWQVLVVGVVFFLSVGLTSVPFLRIWGLFGLGAANTVGCLAAMAMAVALVGRGRPGAFRSRQWRRSMMTLVAGTTGMALSAAGVSSVLHALPASLHLSLGALLSAAVYLGILYALGLPELTGLRRLRLT